MASAIEWTDETWNPLIGCRRVSEGCRNCYAEKQAQFIVGMGGKGGARYLPVVKGGKWTGASVFAPDVLAQPLRWRKPRMVFVCSMSDLFFARHSDEDIAAVFGVMAATPHITYQVLTKRPERARAWFEWIEAHPRFACIGTPGKVGHFSAEPLLGVITDRQADAFDLAIAKASLHTPWPLPNVWLGVSVEDQQRADERIPLLMQCPAAVRFLSVEPLLGPVDLIKSWGDAIRAPDGITHTIDWCIVGNESGPKARWSSIDHVRSVVKQCSAAAIPCFVKQMGRRAYSGPSFERKTAVFEWSDSKGGKRSEWPGSPSDWPQQMPAVQT